MHANNDSKAQKQTDLDLFYSNLARQIPAGTSPIIDLIDGVIVQTTTSNFNDNGESDLDLEYAIALGKLIFGYHDLQVT